MTTVPQSLARRSFPVRLTHALWTTRILFGGPGWRDVVRSLSATIWLLLVTVILVKINRPENGRGVALPMFGALLATVPGLWTVILEEKSAPGLAFIDLLPQREGGLRLFLWPLRLFGLLAAIIVTLAGHLPPAAVPIITGCIWWSISMGHFCSGRGSWFRVLVIPLSLIHSILVASVVFGHDSQSANLVGGGAVAVTPALVTLLFPFRGKVGRLLSRATPRPRRSRAEIDPRLVPAKGLLVLARRRRRLGTTYRAIRIVMASIPGFRWLGPICLLIAVGMCSFTLMRTGLAWSYWMIATMTMSGWLGQSTDRRKLEFLRTRPLSRNRQFAATVLPMIGFALLIPAAQCLFIKASVASTRQYPYDSGVWWFLSRGLGVSRQHLVMTAQGRSIVMSADLVSLLYREALRTGLLGLALLFSFSLLSSARGATRGVRWTSRGLLLVVVAVVLPYYAFSLHRRCWPLPPVWLTAVLAVLTGGCLFRQLFGDEAGRRPQASPAMNDLRGVA